MSNKSSWEAASQPAVHQYVETNFVVPWFRSQWEHIDWNFQDLSNRKAKNADREHLLRSEASDEVLSRVTLERKHDRSDKSDEFAFEMLVNFRLGIWDNLAPRIRKSRSPQEHRAALDRIDKWVLNDYDGNHAGLLLSMLKNLGKHYTVAVKHYPKTQQTECWLLDTKKFQKETFANRSNIDIGRTLAAEKYGDRWTVVLAFVNLPSIHRPHNKPHVSHNCVCGNWDISEVYPKLVDKLEVPEYLNNKYLYN
jgi:hypothetical protein